MYAKPHVNYTKKNLNENVGSPLGHLCFKFERVFNIIQDYVMQYFYFILRILKLFYFLAFEYGRKQLAVSKHAKYLCNSFFGSLLAKYILFKQLNYCRKSHFRAGRGGQASEKTRLLDNSASWKKQ